MFDLETDNGIGLFEFWPDLVAAVECIGNLDGRFGSVFGKYKPH